MELSNIYIVLLCLSLMFLLAQLLVRDKQTTHILFAIFCGSIAIMATQKISGDTIGAYQYLIGMGACATCNGYWLLSRSLFRDKNAILPSHICLALAIALLIIVNQGYLFANSTELITSSNSNLIPYIIRELTILLSSSILVLSFWEGCRGYKKDNNKGKAQRILFLTTFGLAITLSKLTHGLFADSPEYQELSIILIILFVLTNTQILLVWRFKKVQSAITTKLVIDNVTQVEANETHHLEQVLADKVEVLLIEQSLYLKTNLKVADIARELDVPEYKISKALRNNLSAKNFNQYVNELRIKHAKRLLADPEKQKWSVLVVSLESGFASVGPFTRTFKLLTGFTPNQYRQNELA
ncbi:helix-turn-helix domain-containing protein [Colwelliaceae bacterium 6441]